MEYNIVMPPHTRVVSEEDQKGVYEIDGLYPGYGHTLGNSIRRIILSSLPGAAVTKVKIEGVNHEFSTIPGVMEDVVTILMNLKQLRFRMHGEEPETATVDVKGVRDIKGKDFKCPTQLEVANKDHHIASLTDKSASFQAEVTVERGLGFVHSEEIMKDKVPVGTLILDAIFTPVRRVNYEVENMRVGDRTDFNRLRLTIETDGTISPREALKQSISIIRQQIETIEVMEDEVGSVATKDTLKESPSPLDPLELSSRTKNAVVSAGLGSPEELSQKTPDELKELDGVGDKAVTEIKKALGKLGLSLKE